jgi:hypothetical protein
MPGVEGITNHKWWPFEKIIVKETFQTISAFEGDK